MSFVSRTYMRSAEVSLTERWRAGCHQPGRVQVWMALSPARHPTSACWGRHTDLLPARQLEPNKCPAWVWCSGTILLMVSMIVVTLRSLVKIRSIQMLPIASWTSSPVRSPGLNTSGLCFQSTPSSKAAANSHTNKRVFNKFYQAEVTGQFTIVFSVT